VCVVVCVLVLVCTGSPLDSSVLTGGSHAASLKAMLDQSIMGKLQDIRRKNEEWRQKQLRFRAMIAARRSHIADCRWG
jgi:hypothetical protein